MFYGKKFLARAKIKIVKSLNSNIYIYCCYSITKEFIEKKFFFNKFFQS